MTKPFIKIPDIAYSIEGDLIELEQSTGAGEFTYVEIHKIHLELLAEQMGLYKPVHQAHMSEVVKAEIAELFWNLEDHWQALCSSGRVDIEHLDDSKSLYNKLYSICRLIGLNPASLSNLESNKAEAAPTLSKSPVSPTKPTGKPAEELLI